MLLRPSDCIFLLIDSLIILLPVPLVSLIILPSQGLVSCEPPLSISCNVLVLLYCGGVSENLVFFKLIMWYFKMKTSWIEEKTWNLMAFLV